MRRQTTALSRAVALVLVAGISILGLASTAGAAADQPNWQYFWSTPPIDGAPTDRRRIGCFPAGPLPAAPCLVDERTTPQAAPEPWDVVPASPPDPAILSWSTSGNNADVALSPLSPLTPGPDRGVRPTSPTRDYLTPWTNSWRSSQCNPSVFAGGIVPETGPNSFGGTTTNDVNAAIISVFANLNRLHDWSYNHGFTEATWNFQQRNLGRGGIGADPVLGDVQGAAHSAGVPNYLESSAETTPVDGIAPVVNTYLWQPLAATYYPQCADGSFDQTLLAHDYADLLVDRLVDGPNGSLSGSSDGQAKALKEGWSDALAAAYLAERGYAPVDGENPTAIGAYVTGNKQVGIRNYAMNASPLNYSGVQGWDGSGGASPHDDGEIWAAVNWDLRQALLASDPADGSRRWVQLVFDALKRVPANATMVDARDAYLAADTALSGGANHDALWRVFARRGLGDGASAIAPDDPQPRPSFASPRHADEAVVTFELRTAEDGSAVQGEVYVGGYEANVTPIADTIAATPTGSVAELVPGDYTVVFRADGYGAVKQQLTLSPGAQVVTASMPANRASRHRGSAAIGVGFDLEHLIDDTEGTNWRREAASPAALAGTNVTVALAGGAHVVERVQVSALLSGSESAQNRFTALRSFQIWTCRAVAGVSCLEEGDYALRLEAAEAFPGQRPRPLSPDLTLRSFVIASRPEATHVRLRVVANQCTGGPYRGPLAQDPTNNADCEIGAPTKTRQVRAAELQVFSAAPSVAVTPTPPAQAPQPPPPPPPAPPPPAKPPVRPAARCVVPSVKGRSLAKARSAIKRARCRTGRITRVYSARVRRGRVVRQSPRPRVRLRVGGRVNLVVSRGRRR